MTKILRTMAIAIMAVLLLQAPCYASVATSTQDMATSGAVINVEDLEKDQLITLAEGKVCILSYPVSVDEWKISEIRLKVKNVGWFNLEEGVENRYLKVEQYETEQDRVAIKITCKMEGIIAITVIVQNEQTLETQEYTLKVAFAKKIENDTYDDLWMVTVPDDPDSSDDNDESEIPEKPENPENPDNPDDPDNPENPDESEDPDTDKELIIIDTSGWVFEGVQTVYDGKEYVALVKGLPDYVTPIYQDNTRTNAGSNKAYVTFEVPEGYAVPKGMETEISIDKATIGEIELDNYWMHTNLVNGTIAVTMPSNIAPNGVINCTYEVNGIDVGSSYTITDTGMYSVTANFSLAEGMEENYTLTTETAKALYQVNPEMFNPPKYNLYLSELESDDGQKQVSIWIDYADENFSTATVSLKLRYDPDVLELNKTESTKGPNTSYPILRPYDGSDSSGSCTILASGAFADGVALENLVFDVKDSGATDIVVNITGITAADSDPFSGNPAESTHGYGIVLNQESSIISVTLPNKQTKSARENAVSETTEPASSNDMENNDLILDEAPVEEKVEQALPEELGEKQTVSVSDDVENNDAVLDEIPMVEDAGQTTTEELTVEQTAEQAE